MRWKAFFFESNENPKDKKDTFGFKTRSSPPQNPELVRFESDMYGLISNLQYHRSNNPFQKKMQEDLKKLKNSPNIVVEADKTNNIYLVKPSEYKKLVIDNITQSYKICEQTEKENIDQKSARIAQGLELQDRIQKLNENNCFVTLKDHKPNFQTYPKSRLINPSKYELGKVSQQIVRNIVSQMKNVTNFNLWQDTDTALKWFKNSDKSKARFIKFDIVDFYPSITEELLNKSIEFAKSYIEISDESIEIIKHCRSSLLFNEGKTWKKKNGLFDVTMGSFDGAEICELVGMYLLHKLVQIIPQDQVGLYRDDGLAMIPRANGPQMDRLRKDIIKLFKSEGLQITCETNLIETNYLEATMNIRTSKYYPYKKPNNELQYIHTSSNHPPNVIKQIPVTISQRLSKISSDETEFSKVKDEYEKALLDSGHTANLTYEPPEENTATNTHRKRRRNIIWFNPPYNKELKTNLGHKFLKLVEKHFPQNHRYHKIFNKNSIKLSYSCTPNLSMTIKKINRQKIEKIEDKSTTSELMPSKYNCRIKRNCPLNGRCLEKSLNYEAEISTSQAKYPYIGLTEGPFKDRWHTHNTSFTHRSYANSTALSKKIWQLKDRNIPYKISWKILRKAKAYSGGKTCDLCLSEKQLILNSKSKNLLNSKIELISKCRNMNKFMLKRTF